MTIRTLTLAAATLLSVPAFAHTGHDSGNALMAGFTHPFTGIDHLLALMGFGVLAAWQPAALQARVLAGLAAMMVLGALLGNALHLGVWGEAMVLISLVVLPLCGLLTRAGGWLPRIATVSAGLFIASHGVVQVSEGADLFGLSYTAGVVAGSLLLMVAAFAIARRVVIRNTLAQRITSN